jgi:hypothetical protein
VAVIRPHPFNRAFTIIAVIGLMAVAACTSSPGSTTPAPPSSTPQPTVTASPTRSSDPAAALEKLFDEPGLTARLTIYNEIRSTEPAGNVHQGFVGTIEFAGSDEREFYEHSVNGEAVGTEEFISIGSQEWKRTDGGPWVASDATDDAALLTKFDRIGGFENLGIEPKDGRPLHHLRVAGPMLNLQDWGPDDAAFSNVEVDMDFWVEADGTPVTMEMASTFTLTEGGPALELERLSGSSFDAVGGQLAIEPPHDVWPTHRSDALGYTIGYPTGVDVASSDGLDQFATNGGIFLNISSVDAPAGLTLLAWQEDLVAELTADGNAKFRDAEPRRVGGRDAQLLTFTFNANERILLDLIVINDGRAFEIAAISEPDMEAEDLAGLATVLTTFEFTE